MFYIMFSDGVLWFFLTRLIEEIPGFIAYGFTAEER